MVICIRLVCLIILLFPSLIQAAPLSELEREFHKITDNFPGRIGICVADGIHISCVNGDQSFSMQSVVKMITGMAVWDAVDRRQFKIDDPITLHLSDRAIGVQPIAKLIGETGYTTNYDDLVQRMIIDSDTMANDVMIDRLGGVLSLQNFLDHKHISGIRVDRDERDLQTDILGIRWKPDYSDAKIFDQAVAAIPTMTRNNAYKAYLTDPRDTATPRGMADLIYKLTQGDLLSPAATSSIMATLRKTKTFPTRLKAGLQPGWQIGHKTGSSGTWNGLTAATNDVGFLTAPDDRHIAIAVFVADSSATEQERNDVIARLSRITVKYYTKYPH